MGRLLLISGESIVSNGNQPDPNELNLPGDDEQLDGLEGLDLPDLDDAGDIEDFGNLDLPEDGEPLADFDSPAPEAGDEGAFEEISAASDDLESFPEELSDQADEDDLGISEEEEETEAEPKEGIGLTGLAVFAFCGLSVILLLVLDAMVFLGWGMLFMLFMNVFWLMATSIPFIMWMGRKTLNFQEVMLGLSLAAIIIAVSLLLVEMVDYEGEVKPKGGAASAVQLGVESTIAVA